MIWAREMGELPNPAKVRETIGHPAILEGGFVSRINFKSSSRYGKLGGVDRVPRGELPADRVVALRPGHQREHGRYVEAENTLL